MGVPSKSVVNHTCLAKLTSKIIICALMMIAIIHPLPLYGSEFGAPGGGAPTNRVGASPIGPVPVVPSPAALAGGCDSKLTDISYLSTTVANRLRICHPDSVPCKSSLDGGDPRANCRLLPFPQLPPLPPQKMAICQAAFSMCFTYRGGALAVFDAMKNDCGKYRGENLVLCKIGYLAGLMASLDFSKVNGQNHCLIDMPEVISRIGRWQCP